MVAYNYLFFWVLTGCGRVKSWGWDHNLPVG